MSERIVIVQHAKKEGPGLVEEFFRGNGWELEIVDLSDGGTLPHDFDSIAAVIMLGGPMNVYEEENYPFLRDEDSYISRLVVEEIPFLGICLGGQLLAKACGAEVGRSREKEIGWYDVKVSREGMKDLLFRGVEGKIPVFQWHEDAFELPDRGVLLAKGHRCRNQAFRIGEHAYGLQFHPEMTEALIASWLEGLDERDRKRILGETAARLEEFTRHGMAILGNFEKIVESSLRLKRIIREFVEAERLSNKKKPFLWWEENALAVAG